MKKLKVLCAIPLLLIITTLCFGQANDQSQQQATKTVVCPDPKDLVKNPKNMTWSANHKLWKSFNLSFVNKVSTLLGAQWHGEGVGQITCLYQGKDKTSFPIMLIYHIFVLEPHAASWGKNLGGYRNCKSNDPAECPFTVRLKPGKVDIFKEAEKLRKNQGDDTTPNY
jgi:hypothetical protein